jgi:hypothetical protein
MLKRRYFSSEPSKSEASFAFDLDRISLSISRGDWIGAQQIAKEWGSEVSRALGIPHEKVWKEFKRHLAAHWFGRLEKRVFSPGWTVTDALAYARQFRDRNLRVSCFPEDIACHAKSFRLSAHEEDHWLTTLASLDRSVLIEMFPESDSSTGICFRRFASAFGEEVLYEAGRGQAMAVFEEEQGMHPTVYASKTDKMRYSMRGSNEDIEIADITRKLRLLIRKHDQSIQSKCSDICRKTGIEGLGLEGYFNSDAVNDLVVVDLDLPFDFVFMRPTGPV